MKQNGSRCVVLNWYLCQYNIRKSRYACKIKGCKHKRKNGRCGLDMCRLETDESYKLTGNCLDYKEKKRTWKN